ncbi:MAG: hypothetical protein HN642_00705, partial [Methylococcales bacterium]|nr:hypothetical protein [Methylococcales bacterium]
RGWELLLKHDGITAQHLVTDRFGVAGLPVEGFPEYPLNTMTLNRLMLHSIDSAV